MLVHVDLLNAMYLQGNADVLDNEDFAKVYAPVDVDGNTIYPILLSLTARPMFGRGKEKNGDEYFVPIGHESPNVLLPPMIMVAGGAGFLVAQIVATLRRLDPAAMQHYQEAYDKELAHLTELHSHDG